MVVRGKAMDYHYDLLGLSPSATQEEIRSAYKREALIHHPDRASGCAEMFQEVQHAYEVLTQVKTMSAEMQRGRDEQREKGREKHYKPKTAPAKPEIVSCGTCLRTLETADDMLRVGSMQVGDIIETHLGDWGVVMGVFDADIYWVKNGAEVASKLASRDALINPGIGGVRWKLVKHMRGAQQPPPPPANPSRTSRTHSRPAAPRSNSAAAAKPPMQRSSSMSYKKKRQASGCATTMPEAQNPASPMTPQKDVFARSYSGTSSRFAGARDSSPSIRRFNSTRGLSRKKEPEAASKAAAHDDRSSAAAKAPGRGARPPLSDFREPRSPGPILSNSHKLPAHNSALHRDPMSPLSPGTRSAPLSPEKAAPVRSASGVFADRKTWNTKLDLSGVVRVDSAAPKVARTPRDRSSSFTFGSVKSAARPRTPRGGARHGKSTQSSSFAEAAGHPSQMSGIFAPAASTSSGSANGAAPPRHPHTTANQPAPCQPYISNRVCRSNSLNATRRRASSQPPTPRAGRKMSSAGHAAPKPDAGAERGRSGAGDKGGDGPPPTRIHRSNSRARLVRRGVTLRSCTPNTHSRLL